MSVVVSAKDLVVGYGSRAVATVGTFEIDTRRITVVTGPNGAGKTTLLKTIAGLLPPLAGSLQPAIGRGEGGAVFVHSTPFLFAGTVRTNMLLSSPGHEHSRRALRRLNADGLWEQDVRRLSSGQRQRVALARALAANPRLLLVDEPEGGLDASAIGNWRQVLRDATDTGTPGVVLATHSTVGIDGLPFQLLVLEDRSRLSKI
jgi:ABC-type Mn2+/Zn2+ transport system ATPase subunit